MKILEARRVGKVIDSLKKVKELLVAEKLGRAIKAVESLTAKLEKKLATVPKSASKKKPLSGFPLYVQKNWDLVAPQHKGKKAPEIMKILGKLYKADAASETSSVVSVSSTKSKKAKSPKAVKAPKAQKVVEAPKSPKAKKVRAPRKTKA